MQVGIAGNQAAKVFPLRRAFRQSRLERIIEDIPGHRFEGTVPGSFAAAQAMIVGLFLKKLAAITQLHLAVPFFSKQGHGEPLIALRCVAQSSDEEMAVIRHETISGADQVVTAQGVQEGFANLCMHERIKPAGAAFADRHTPVNPFLAPVGFGWKTGKTSFEFGFLG